MNRLLTPRVACATAAALVASLMADPACAGSLTVRDSDGSQWTVNEDPAEDANDFLLRHIGASGSVDLRFGRDGLSAFSLGTSNDAPASVRVDSTRRIWMVGTSLTGNQPQPIVARFLPDGAADLRWGVQGKVQASPIGLGVKPNDLLPLADGSVLVAGEASGLGTPKAVVFHLNADGSLDMHFGVGGYWQRGDDTDASSATSLATSTDGTAAVAVAVRGAKPGAELWSLNEVPLTLIMRKPLDDSSDGEDLRTEWVSDHWALDAKGGPTGVVAPALLTNHARAHAAPVASAASDPGEGGFNPFAADPASAPAAATADDEGLPWLWGGLAALAVAVAGTLGAFVARSRKASATIRHDARR